MSRPPIGSRWGVFVLVLGWALAVAGVGVGAAAPARSDTLWNGSASTPARVRLINEVGGVRVVVDPAASGVEVRGAAAELTVEAVSGESMQLTVRHRGGGTAQHPLPEPGGDVELRVPGGSEVGVETSRGAVLAELSPVSGPLAVETTTGEIEVWVLQGGGATVDLRTSGEMTVDYSIAIDYHYHEEPAKWGRLSIGDGVTPVSLMSREGTIRVLRR